MKRVEDEKTTGVRHDTVTIRKDYQFNVTFTATPSFGSDRVFRVQHYDPSSVRFTAPCGHQERVTYTQVPAVTAALREAVAAARAGQGHDTKAVSSGTGREFVFESYYSDHCWWVRARGADNQSWSPILAGTIADMLDAAHRERVGEELAAGLDADALGAQARSFLESAQSSTTRYAEAFVRELERFTADVTARAEAARAILEKAGMVEPVKAKTPRRRAPKAKAAGA